MANKFQTGFDQPLLCGMYVDKRLAGIQAVQTLSRLNRAHPGKDTTYVLDFVNDTEEVLAAFKTYYTTAELSADVTDPNLVFNLRAKLDAAGHYDDFEVDRVVAVELKPNAKQSELVAALEPVVDRLMKRYKAAQEALKGREGEAGRQGHRSRAERAERPDPVSRPTWARSSGSTRSFRKSSTTATPRSRSAPSFSKRLLPLLEFGREREGIDLSKVVLTHHNLKNLGKRAMPLRRRRKPQAGTHHRSRQRQRAGERESLPEPRSSRR